MRKKHFSKSSGPPNKSNKLSRQSKTKTGQQQLADSPCGSTLQPDTQPNRQGQDAGAGAASLLSSNTETADTNSTPLQQHAPTAQQVSKLRFLEVDADGSLQHESFGSRGRSASVRCSACNSPNKPTGPRPSSAASPSLPSAASPTTASADVAATSAAESTALLHCKGATSAGSSLSSRPAWNSTSKVNSSNRRSIKHVSSSGSRNSAGRVDIADASNAKLANSDHDSPPNSKSSSGGSRCNSSNGETVGLAGSPNQKAARASPSFTSHCGSISQQRPAAARTPGKSNSIPAASHHDCNAISVYVEHCEAPGLQPCDTLTRREAAGFDSTSACSSLETQPLVLFHCVSASDRASGPLQEQRLKAGAPMHGTSAAEEQQQASSTAAQADGVAALLPDELCLAGPLDLKSSSDSACLLQVLEQPQQHHGCQAGPAQGSGSNYDAATLVPDKSYLAALLDLQSSNSVLDLKRAGSVSPASPSTVLQQQQQFNTSLTADTASIAGDRAAAAAVIIHKSSSQTAYAGEVMTAATSAATGDALEYAGTGKLNSSCVSRVQLVATAQDADGSCLFSTPKKGERKFFSQHRTNLHEHAEAHNSPEPCQSAPSDIHKAAAANVMGEYEGQVDTDMESEGLASARAREVQADAGKQLPASSDLALLLPPPSYSKDMCSAAAAAVVNAQLRCHEPPGAAMEHQHQSLAVTNDGAHCPADSSSAVRRRQAEQPYSPHAAAALDDRSKLEQILFGGGSTDSCQTDGEAARTIHHGQSSDETPQSASLFQVSSSRTGSAAVSGQQPIPATASAVMHEEHALQLSAGLQVTGGYARASGVISQGAKSPRWSGTRAELTAKAELLAALAVKQRHQLQSKDRYSSCNSSEADSTELPWASPGAAPAVLWLQAQPYRTAPAPVPSNTRAHGEASSMCSGPFSGVPLTASKECQHNGASPDVQQLPSGAVEVAAAEDASRERVRNIAASRQQVCVIQHPPTTPALQQQQQKQAEINLCKTDACVSSSVHNSTDSTQAMLPSAGSLQLSNECGTAASGQPSSTDDFLAAEAALGGYKAEQLLPEAQALAVEATASRTLLQQLSSTNRNTAVSTKDSLSNRDLQHGESCTARAASSRQTSDANNASSTNSSRRSSSHADIAAVAAPSLTKRASRHSRQVSMDGCSDVDWLNQLQQDGRRHEQNLSGLSPLEVPMPSTKQGSTGPYNDSVCSISFGGSHEQECLAKLLGPCHCEHQATAQLSEHDDLAKKVETLHCERAAIEQLQKHDNLEQQLESCCGEHTATEQLHEHGHTGQQQYQQCAVLVRVTDAATASAGASGEHRINRDGVFCSSNQPSAVAKQHSSVAQMLVNLLGCASIPAVAEQPAADSSTVTGTYQCNNNHSGNISNSTGTPTTGQTGHSEVLNRCDAATADKQGNCSCELHTTHDTAVPGSAAAGNLASSSALSSKAATVCSLTGTRCSTPLAEQSSLATPDACQIPMQGVTLMWNQTYEPHVGWLDHCRPFTPEQCQLAQQMDCIAAGEGKAERAVCTDRSTSPMVAQTATSLPCSGPIVEIGVSAAVPACQAVTDAATSPNVPDSSSEADVEGLPVLQKIPSLDVTDAATRCRPTTQQELGGDAAWISSSNNTSRSHAELSSAFAVLTSLKGMLQEDVDALRASLSTGTLQPLTASMQAQQLDSVATQGQQTAGPRSSSTHTCDNTSACGAQMQRQSSLQQLLHQLVCKLSTYVSAAQFNRTASSCSEPLARVVLHQLYPADASSTPTSYCGLGVKGLTRTLSSQVRQILAGGGAGIEPCQASPTRVKLSLSAAAQQQQLQFGAAVAIGEPAGLLLHLLPLL